jgi:hypothetical protein
VRIRERNQGAFRRKALLLEDELVHARSLRNLADEQACGLEI